MVSTYQDGKEPLKDNERHVRYQITADSHPGVAGTFSRGKIEHMCYNDGPNDEEAAHARRDARG